MQPVLIYTKAWCPYCVRAKSLLKKLNVDFEEVDVEKEPVRLPEMVARSGRHTVPQIWVGTTHVGGCDDLYALYRAGELEALLGTRAH